MSASSTANSIPTPFSTGEQHVDFNPRDGTKPQVNWTPGFKANGPDQRGPASKGRVS